MMLPAPPLQPRPVAGHPAWSIRIRWPGNPGCMLRSVLLAASLLLGSLAPVSVNAETSVTGNATAASASVPGSVPGAPNASTAAPTTVPGAAASGSAPLDPESDRRLRALSAELRCLVCQNQTLADSNAELAVDLRRQVEAMIARGDSDAQIKTYLVDRYGDFVLYRPPVQGNTALLWFGPFALLVIGAIVWGLVQRRSRRAQPVPPPSVDAEKRARSLLDD